MGWLRRCDCRNHLKFIVECCEDVFAIQVVPLIKKKYEWKNLSELFSIVYVIHLVRNPHTATVNRTHFIRVAKSPRSIYCFVDLRSLITQNKKAENQPMQSLFNLHLTPPHLFPLSRVFQSTWLLFFEPSILPQIVPQIWGLLKITHKAIALIPANPTRGLGIADAGQRFGDNIFGGR